jgi:hypothetical protein
LLSDQRSALGGRLSALGLVLLATGCEIEKISIPPTESRIALHGVLSASASTQVVLLERTRNGTVQINNPSFDVPDPVVTDAGVAESGAIVTLTAPDGTTYVAREDNTVRDDFKGAGMYRFSLPGSQLQRGATYSLLVVTTGGQVITAETTVPDGAAAVLAEQRDFDRASEALLLQWPASPGARSYLVRVETPFGPRSFFTDSTHVRLGGDLRNPDVTSLTHVFIPGFPQAVTVSAVDSNYYDWYRTHNERLSGTGLVSRVRGALGFFGSLVRLRFLDLHVVAPQTEPAAGMFAFDGTPFERSVTPVWNLELYLESRSARPDQADALSGRYHKRPILGDPSCVTCGLLGTARNGRVELVMLGGWSARDTTDVFSGEIRGDTIVGTFRGLGSEARFVRQP